MERSEELLTEIELLVESCSGASCSNPRYFASMFAGTMSCTQRTEEIALEELRNAVERIELRQRVARLDAQGAFIAGARGV